MSDSVLIAIIAAISGGSITGLIQFLVTRKDNKDTEKDENEERLAAIETEIKKLREETKANLKEIRKSMLRLELLELMHNTPKRHEEVMKVAEEYFVKYSGDWYMTDMLNNYLTAELMAKPSWLKVHD